MKHSSGFWIALLTLSIVSMSCVGPTNNDKFQQNHRLSCDGGNLFQSNVYEEKVIVTSHRKILAKLRFDTKSGKLLDDSHDAVTGASFFRVNKARCFKITELAEFVIEAPETDPLACLKTLSKEEQVCETSHP